MVQQPFQNLIPDSLIAAAGRQKNARPLGLGVKKVWKLANKK